MDLIELQEQLDEQLRRVLLLVHAIQKKDAELRELRAELEECRGKTDGA